LNKEGRDLDPKVAIAAGRRRESASGFVVRRRSGGGIVKEGKANKYSGRDRVIGAWHEKTAPYHQIGDLRKR